VIAADPQLADAAMHGPRATVPVRPPSCSPWTGVRRRLAVRLDAAGDVLMTGPALRALRARDRDEHLALLVSTAGAPAARLLPEVDEVIVYDPPWMPAPLSRRDPSPDLAMIEQLRERGFDGAAIFTVHSQSPQPAAMLAYLAGIPRRLAHSAENPYGLLTDWVPDPERDAPVRHEVRRQLDLLAAVSVAADEDHLSLRVPADSTVAMRARLARLGLEPGAGFVVIHPGASAASRRYPPERFGAVARGIVRELGLRVVLTGSAAEAPLVDAVRSAAGVPVVRLAGRLSFAEFAALLSLSPLVVTNNTAAAHVAAAVATPVVVVYAMTNVQHTPWRVPSRVVTAEVPCRGCRRSECPLGHHACLASIEPAEVIAAVADLGAEAALVRPGLVAGFAAEAIGR
jgi:lipopolysaccharide heptosyltransferase II